MDWMEAIEFIDGVHERYPGDSAITLLYWRVRCGHRSMEVLQSVEALKAAGYDLLSPEPSPEMAKTRPLKKVENV